jgi:hypothetical protein
MNYQRGFLYAMLALAWVALLLFVLPSDRLWFWVAEPSEMGTVRQARGKYPPTKQIEFEGIVYEFPNDFADADIQKALSATEPNGVSPVYAARDFSSYREFAKGSTIPFKESRNGKFTWLGRILLLPPLFGYVVIFVVVPWIYRVAAKQI